jgi:hypothetical protein
MRKNQTPKFFYTERDLCGFFILPELARKFFWANETCSGKKPSRTNLPRKKTALSKLAGEKTRANKTSGKIFPSWTPVQHPKFSMLVADAGLVARAGFEKLVATAGF